MLELQIWDKEELLARCIGNKINSHLVYDMGISRNDSLVITLPYAVPHKDIPETIRARHRDGIFLLPTRKRPETFSSIMPVTSMVYDPKTHSVIANKRLFRPGYSFPASRVLYDTPHRIDIHHVFIHPHTLDIHLLPMP